MATKSLNFKVDEDLKVRFDSIARAVGLSTSALLTVLMKGTVDYQGIPFEVSARRDSDFLNSEITRLAMEKIPAKKIDFSKQADLEDFFDEEY